MNSELKIIDISANYRSDERGWSISPLTAELSQISPEGNFHITSITPGSVRGNHKHLLTDEWIVVWGGGLFAWGTEEEVHQVAFAKGTAHLIFVPRGIYHSFKNTGTHDIFLFSYFVLKPGDYEKEIVRKNIL